jgi:hypothetical protein
MADSFMLHLAATSFRRGGCLACWFIYNFSGWISTTPCRLPVLVKKYWPGDHR